MKWNFGSACQVYFSKYVTVGFKRMEGWVFIDITYNNGFFNEYISKKNFNIK